MKRNISECAAPTNWVNRVAVSLEEKRTELGGAQARSSCGSVFLLAGLLSVTVAVTVAICRLKRSPAWTVWARYHD